jgi:hypothetical protein
VASALRLRARALHRGAGLHLPQGAPLRHSAFRSRRWLPALEHPGQQDLGLHAIPYGWLPPGVQKQIEGLAHLSGDARQAAAGRVADELATDEVPVATYGVPQTSQFVGPGIGCRLFTSFGYGLDLAATCLNRSAS